MSEEHVKSPYAMHFWRNHFEWQNLRDKYPQIKGRMLDVGCGCGHSDVILVENKVIDSVVGIDIDEERIGVAKSIAIPGCEFLCGTITDSLGLFDSAWSSHTFEHIADHQPIFDALNAVMKPGAYLLISVPLGKAYDEPGHLHHWGSGQEAMQFFSKYNVNIVDVTVNVINQVIRILIKF